MNVKETDESISDCGAPSLQSGLIPWLKLFAGIVLILFFIFGIGSLSKRIPGARRMGEVIEERNLRATAVFYTDFEASAEGSERIRHSLEYPPAALNAEQGLQQAR